MRIVRHTRFGRDVLFRAVKFAVAPIILVAIWLGGCAKQLTAQEQCVTNMQILEDTLRCYRLVRNIPDDRPVDPAAFTPEYLRPKNERRYLACPESGKPYAPFAYSTGPECPTNPEHTAAFRQSWETR